MTAASRLIDVGVPRFDQAMVAALVGLAFLVRWWKLVAGTAVAPALTRLGEPRRGIFRAAPSDHTGSTSVPSTV